MRARPRPGVLTQPRGSQPGAARGCCCRRKGGESRPPAPWGHCGTPHTHTHPGRGTAGVRDLMKMGEVGAGGGTRGPRRRARSSHPNWKEPVLPEETLQLRAPRGTLPGAPHQQPRILRARAARGAQGGCGKRGGRGTPRAPAEMVRTPPNTPALPARSVAKRQGRVGPGAPSRARVLGASLAGRPGPRRRWRGRPSARRRRRYLP